MAFFQGQHQNRLLETEETDNQYLEPKFICSKN